MKTTNSKLWIAFLIAAFGLVASCAMPLLFIVFHPGAKGTSADPAITLSVLCFAGLVGLIAILTLVACTFAALELSDKTQALGLPEGSIRAVIALGLIVIFVISSLFLFGRLAEGQTVVTKGLTAEQVAQIPVAELMKKDADKVADGAPPTFTVTRHLGPTRASEDFSRQLLTTISTLVVAIASFYFGSKAVDMGKTTMSEIARPPSGPETPGTAPSPTTPATPTTPQAPAGGGGPGGTPEVKPPAPNLEERLAQIMAKRPPLAELPESSGVLQRDANNKLELTGTGARIAAPSNLGQIGDDHWLATAKKVEIGDGKIFKPLFVVIHYTEGFSADSSITDWKKRTDGVLAHVIVDRNGKIFQCRPFNQVCFHAGTSRTRDPKTGKLYESLNSFSIGIEIANAGGEPNLHARLPQLFPDAKVVPGIHRNAGVRGADAASPKRTRWESFPEAQTSAVFGLVRLLMKKYDILDITGHDCIAFERKSDPGPAFPMAILRQDNGLSGLPEVWNEHGNKIEV